MFYMCICVILAALSFSFTCVKVFYWPFFLYVVHVYLCYIGCSFFKFYMGIGVILAVLPFSFTCVKVLYLLFFPLVLHVHRCYIDFFLLVLHVYMCNISCSSFIYTCA